MNVDETTKQALIDEVLHRSVDTIYPSAEALRAALKSGKKLRIYVGIDPTATYVHLGHSTNYLLLERLHKLGHKIIVLVGDFTAMVGDPSDKTAARVRLTLEEVKDNLRTFKTQIGKILDFEATNNPIEFAFNSKWLAPLDFEKLAELASNFTVQQMLERDMFEKRIQDKKPLFVHEFLYPLMQGYDSVALNVDLEIGGTDQTFNMLAGRTLVKRYQDREKFVMTTTLLVNPKTGEKLMSKSHGTGVGLDLEAQEMYAKVMALPDEGLVQCFIDCTRFAMAEIEIIKRKLEDGTNPKQIKMRLAREIVSMYHSAKDAKEAEIAFERQFSQGELPADIPSHQLEVRKWEVVELLVAAELSPTKSEARRLLQQGGVKLNQQKVIAETVFIKSGDVLQAGKRRFIRVG